MKTSDKGIYILWFLCYSVKLCRLLTRVDLSLCLLDGGVEECVDGLLLDIGTVKVLGQSQ